MGSSPLARGLHGCQSVDVQTGGIIPARAGFTAAAAASAGHSADHPRSRGVYAEELRARAGDGGSSPLARGLLGIHCHWFLLTGIIPARAGFTRRPWPQPPGSPDHPRSRGVYLRARQCAWPFVGSSPLARGLPTGQAMSLALRGIIPARAGFTRPSKGRSSPGTDHPRSRGVYQTFNTLEVPVTGIIPARAGFTRTVLPTTRVSPDHPRSRGVYSVAAWSVTTVPGSSPLARGLPTVLRQLRARRRIIPARAGFTDRP